MAAKSQTDRMGTGNRNDDHSYMVVARRYRPQSFSDLVGQTQVATALSNAIKQDRVGHAYLLTGARGVGKTSTARIFAKCLNCQDGPSIEPCDKCDICLGIVSGEDVDVIEIDGASNNGIEEVRQLRANSIVRPSRARFKIYIIDEVHMLSRAAFNGLLKTLEEPPAHVKFIFCTTDPEKIPITVLSRCQRFDLPPIQITEIKNRLRQIVAGENLTADDEALELLARRAEGSMRDSQSLLEQLMSFTTGNITVADVNLLLGTADNRCIFEIVEAIAAGKAAEALQTVENAISGGVDAGQLTEQVLGLLRDAMACQVGCASELLLHTSSDDTGRLVSLCESLGIEKLIALMQTFDQALVRMRHSTYVRTLLETAIVRACHLENIDQIPELIRTLNAGNSPVGTTGKTDTKKNKIASQRKPTQNVDLVSDRKNPGEPTTQTQSAAKTLRPVISEEKDPVDERGPQGVQWDENNLPEVWRSVLEGLGDMTAEVASNFDALELSDENQLIVTLKTDYDRQLCCRPERKNRLEQAILQSTGKRIRLDFRVNASAVKDEVRPIHMTKRQRTRLVEKEDFVRVAVELFDAEIVDLNTSRKEKN